jgi:hypothetical protein
MRDSRNLGSAGGDRPVVLIGPVAGFALAGCAFVSTAVWLGAEWPRLPAAGMPFGVWAVLLGSAGVATLERVRGRRGDRSRAASVEEDLSNLVGRMLPRAYEAFRSGWRRLGWSEAGLERAERGWCDHLDRSARRARPLNVGLDLPPSLAEALTAAPGLLPVRWVGVSCPEGAEQPVCRARVLDAVVRVCSQGAVRVTTSESPERESAWHDWARPRPLSYASAFPLRVDPTQATLCDPGEFSSHDVRLMRALVEAAAVSARTPARLTLGDRLGGRRPMTLRPGSEDVIVEHAGADAALRRLAELAIDPGWSPALARTALRVASGWLASCDHADAGLRRRVAEAAAQSMSDEPEALLRLAAARFATLDDAGGFEAIVTADRFLRKNRPEPILDHLAFLQSEVELGLPTPTTLGRVAAGICLVCAAAPDDRLPYIRDDVLDDLRYSGWLVGRDQDRAVLIEVFRVLERARETGDHKAAA